MIGINILSHLLAEETVHLKDDLSTFEFKQHSISHFLNCMDTPSWQATGLTT